MAGVPLVPLLEDYVQLFHVPCCKKLILTIHTAPILYIITHTLSDIFPSTTYHQRYHGNSNHGDTSLLSDNTLIVCSLGIMSTATLKTGTFAHLSFESLTDFENLRKSEGVYFSNMHRIGTMLMGAATLGAYLCAKSVLFQDRFAALLIAAGVIFMVSNSPSYFYTWRLGLSMVAYFFLGMSFSTILWYNFGVNIWTIVRVLFAMTVSKSCYVLPCCLMRKVVKATEDETQRQISDTNRLWFFGTGPVASYVVLYLLEIIINRVFGTYMLTPGMRMKLVAFESVFNFLNGQFSFVKCSLFDRDPIWHNFQIYTDLLASFYFVPKSLLSKPEDEY